MFIRFLQDLDDATLVTIAFGLPEFNHRLFAAKCSGPPEPKHAGTEMRVRGRVIQQEQRFGVTCGGIERVVEDHEHVDIVWDGLIRDERTKNNEAGKIPGAFGDGVDPFKPLKHQPPLAIEGPKYGGDFIQR